MVARRPTTGNAEGRVRTRPSLRSLPARLLEPGRNLERAGDDLRLVAVHQRDVRLRHGRIDLAHADAVVLEVEDEVAATLELAGLDLRDRLVDTVVDPFHAAREHALGERVLVDVHTDAPHAGLVGRLEGAETAAAC